MVLKDGNKYACESCIRGHRVSGCNHTDRELHFIAPKGRPVKQCDHCRGARKSKSHHAKCDCGGRKERGEVKLDDKNCCCTLGDNCICGLKNASELRVDTALANPPHPRPGLVKGTSESHIETYYNEQHKACHKPKHYSQMHGVPYPCPRTNTGSGASNTPSSADCQGQIRRMEIPHRGSKDDSALLSPSSGLYSSSSQAQLSVDNLPLSSFSGGSLFNSQTYQQYSTSTPIEGQDQLPFSPNDSCSEQFLNELMSANSTTSPAEELLSQLQTTPDLYQSQEEVFGGDHPSFSPADLPLTSSTFSTNFPQPTSFSEESNAQSAPGLTAASSTTHSELGDAHTLIDGMPNPFDANNVFPASFDLQNMASFTGGSPTTVQKPVQPPTSEPAENSRRSLDIETMRSLSSFPAFDDTLESYLSNTAIVNSAASDANSFVGSFPGTSGLAFDTQQPTSTPTSNPGTFKPSPTTVNFDSGMTSTAVNDRPRSMPIPIAGAYNPNTTINNLYPQLDQDFSAAAAWDPSALDIGSSSFQFPLQ
ncbi:hypothetical protein NA57DRAFT_76979 [Rhizodiscina lignyota]|uniref:Copper-fist domain-containing protein n=1 Tax=Rhizodiscina lignyota TaxID=1504668 RepID=A0A9P4M5S8_9PEZI|nr:hypothetical protein NA57DRAFT_76979 [Rhizodiscina lignyota]